MLLKYSQKTPHIEDPEIARKTEERLVKLLYQKSVITLFTFLVIALALWWFLTLSHGYFWPSVWVAAFGTLLVVRLHHIGSYFKKPPLKNKHKSSVSFFWFTSFLTGIIWSSAILFFKFSEEKQFLSLYSVLTVGIACIAIYSLAPLPKIYPTYLCGLLLPVSGYYILQGGLENVSIGVSALFFLGFGPILSRQYRHNLIQSISFELINLRMAENLQDENSKAELLNMNLLEEVAKREQTEKELLVAIDEAHAASKAKSDFLAVISHEIRTPMNGILGMLDLVMDTELTEIQRDYLNTANQSAETLLRLLNDLLDFSKTDQAGLKLENRTFSLLQSTTEITSLMGARAEKKGLNFICKWDDRAPDWVIGDPVRFRQVLGNLVGNAVKFTEKGEVKVSLARFDRVEEKISYTFTVEDSGIGISSTDLGKLFDPFKQVDNSMSRKYGGTGLGLSISRQLVRLMGGDIEISSKIGEGSCFTFEVHFTEPGPYEIEKKVELDSAVLEDRKFSGQVLVVEDDPINQRVIRLLLERLGLKVGIAENGKVGVERVKSDQWDLVFMDCQMPVLDGITATIKIREYEWEQRLRRTPIVALTANAQDSDREACKDGGMDGFLEKPLRGPALVDALSEWLLADSMSEKC